ncbi:RagB/SusD family nutrient uptake outer membrane protein [Mucilaginibacter sp. KACC 22773]|uniref:RagB/SusD family nutrient uptake outer membrane protein n=1 Tax=Mucilaginibacter sp. KACC 22773 TaxID=3025671 RepID=UPI0023653A7D|nr:RagB/SusD family nutrient uptake outer membrane protein [Mucilaginibacter sp. KACC 22773]WDF77132.1 RagB/SusD family nutrient uptake outer membrane protein [Mucilaginibacter sp. KACC 22773]
MFNRKLIKGILASVASLILCSCNKELSAPPRNEVVDINAVTSQSKAQIVLNGAYFRLANANSSNFTNWSFHEVTGSVFTGYLGYGFGVMQDESNSNQASTFSQGIWDDCYKLVEATNGTISGITALADNAFTGNRKNEMLGEARFLRAYTNYRLLSYFAQWYDISSKYGILIRDAPSTLSNIVKARSDVRSSYDFIITDCDFAIANAPSSNPNYYATKWAAMALKMRVLMSRGQQGDYAQVITLAENIKQSNIYALENNLKDIFYTKGLASSEVILGIKPNTGQETFYYNLSYQYYPGGSGLWVAKQALKDLLQNDPRGSWMVGPASRYNAYSPNTYYFTKYIAYATVPTQVSETAYAFRLSEVYLLEAEATIRSGGSLSTAKALIKTVMAKAGVTDFSAVDNASTADALLLQNYDEISRNLVGEDGADWMAMLRFPLATVTQLKPTITSTAQYILPIPSSEYQSNPTIGPQNPGYSY